MSSNRRRLIFHCSRSWRTDTSEEVASSSERDRLSVSGGGDTTPPPRSNERQANEDGSGV